MTAMDLTHLRETNRADRSIRRPTLIAAAAAMALFLAAPDAALAMNFTDALKRVDYGLQKNPARVPAVALDSCRKRRDFAVKLYEAREIDRAEQSLKTCFDLLKISETPTKVNEKAGLSIAEFQAEAAREIEEALDLTPNIEKGLEIYRGCASCHKPEGWGLKNGSVPQVAGQHHTVVIKQLADIRAGNRSNPMMLRHASVAAVGGPQAVADVAGYIATLKISPENGKGFGRDLELGERLYGEHCARCHGAAGEGDAEKHAPRIQARHYKYLVRQFRWIRDGKRLNANAEKVVQIDGFKDSEAKAVLDYVSRLEPPPELRAPADWRNPDFAD